MQGSQLQDNDRIRHMAWVAGFKHMFTQGTCLPVCIARCQVFLSHGLYPSQGRIDALLLDAMNNYFSTQLYMRKNPLCGRRAVHCGTP
jgi:hypothetical protein